MSISFTLHKKDRRSEARLGTVKTPHGEFQTPAFVTVGTLATVRALSSQDLLDLGVEVALANTYHLHFRPGSEVVKRMGGLHKFMNLNKPLFTDSGGFQAFSLGFGMEHGTGKIGGFFPDEGFTKPKPVDGKWAKVDEDGVHFKNPITGDKVHLTPKLSMKIQHDLGADMILAFDECTSPLHDYDYTKKALERTNKWEKICVDYHNKSKSKQALIGITQGGTFKDLREESTRSVNELDVEGFAIGGNLGDKSKTQMHDVLEWTIPLLDRDKPVHLLGIGAVEDIFNSVERGIDTFDCVTPTRLARHGYLFLTPKAGGKKENKYRFSIKNAENRESKRPIDPNCACSTCETYSRAYLRHLFLANELTYFRLASIHNLHFFLEMMRTIRKSIKDGKFLQLKKEWVG